MKAILLIDKPESCTSCLLGIYNKKWFCLGTNKDIDITDRYNIPEWCPLRPLPQKKVGYDLYERYGSWTLSDEKEVSYRVGFNDCLEEILGEEEYEQLG